MTISLIIPAKANDNWTEQFDKGLADWDLYGYQRDGSSGGFQTKLSSSITSGFSIQNGILYFGSLDRYFYAVDAQTGKLIWKTQEATGNWFWANPTMVNNEIYAPNMDGNVYVLDTTNGQVTNTIKLGYSISSTPVLISNKLFVATENGKIWSINTSDYTAQMVFNYQKKIYAPLAARQNILYVITEDNNLHAFNSTSGLDLFGPIPLSG